MENQQKEKQTSSKNNFTRGNGLLEGFLAKKRAKEADKLILSKYREGRILDIGCGSKPYFLMSIDFKEKYGLEKILKTHNYSNKIKIKNFDIELSDKLPFKDEYFDVVTMLAVIEHIEMNRISIITREIRRVLKKDGLFILTTPTIWTDRLLRVMAKFKLVSVEEIEEHKTILSPSKITSTLKKADFLEHNIDTGYFEAFMNIKAKAIK